ncbi:hypothetical protein Kisp01_27640 [Kineosporia sp. NBRC 101677]|nr:hypothetical protein Kisp01_27640 [Kineosporia sp. NBRC 101677]
MPRDERVLEQHLVHIRVARVACAHILVLPADLAAADLDVPDGPPFNRRLRAAIVRRDMERGPLDGREHHAVDFTLVAEPFRRDLAADTSEDGVLPRHLALVCVGGVMVSDPEVPMMRAPEVPFLV